MIRATTEIQQAAGILAEFNSQDRLISAAKEVRNFLVGVRLDS